MNSKQIIVVRRDLKMPKGKMAAQVSHASMACILNLFRDSDNNYHYETKEDCGVSQWLNGSFTKVVLYCNSLEEILEVKKKADDAGLLTALIEDEGRTVFNEPTVTCLGIGPDFSDKFTGITDHLKLAH